MNNSSLQFAISLLAILARCSPVKKIELNSFKSVSDTSLIWYSLCDSLLPNDWRIENGLKQRSNP